MYINSIKIKKYRNYENFYMKFKEGLNVIIGPNNAGKTNLLYAVNLIKNLHVEIDDFNKNDLFKKYKSEYKKEAPFIEIEYEIFHEISEDDENDESIIKLLPFLSLDKINEMKKSEESKSKYLVMANVKIKYELNKAYLKEYCDLVKDVEDFSKYMGYLEIMQKHYEWNICNGMDSIAIDKKVVSDLFKIDFIGAERNTNDVYSETKNQLNKYIKEEENSKKISELANKISSDMEEAVKDVLKKIETVVNTTEDNEIGLKDGNVSIKQVIKYKPDISNGYQIDVEDTNSKYILPLTHNGVGYNNLINIYMLLKLVELKTGQDFRILCLEEPEAHLHPAMQYKLFKYIKKIDDENKLNQQIFVTTHSSNITSVAGLENMYIIDYNRELNEVKNMNLLEKLKDNEESKRHVMKFLDVTKSDMLFAKKIILVEGLAERMLLPKFMEKLGYPYENEHISIVEIGGKHFKYFMDLYMDGNIKKKILCVTDRDLKIENKDDLRKISSFIPEHISKLIRTDVKRRKFNVVLKLKNIASKKYRHKKIYYVRENIAMVSQQGLGYTFEDELFLANINHEENTIKLLKMATPKSLYEFIDDNKLNFDDWKRNVESIGHHKTKEKIKKIINQYDALVNSDYMHSEIYKKLFFSNLFLSYIDKNKGEIALKILLDEELINTLKVPSYIKDGIEWLAR